MRSDTNDGISIRQSWLRDARHGNAVSDAMHHGGTDGLWQRSDMTFDDALAACTPTRRYGVADARADVPKARRRKPTISDFECPRRYPYLEGQHPRGKLHVSRSQMVPAATAPVGMFALEPRSATLAAGISTFG